MNFIQEEEVFRRKLKGFDPDKFASEINHPSEIGEKIMEILRFYGAKGIARQETLFHPRLPSGHKPKSLSRKEATGEYPGWQGVIEIRLEDSVDEFFGNRRRETTWKRAIEYIAPFLIRGAKTESRAFGVRYNFVVFARDMPQVLEFFKKNDPVKIMNDGMMFYHDEQVFMSDWRRNRLPGLLMINPEAGSILVKKEMTREDRIMLDIYRREARKEDAKYIDKHLRELYSKYDIDYSILKRTSEYLDTPYNLPSVPNAWLLTDDRNIY